MKANSDQQGAVRSQHETEELPRKGQMTMCDSELPILKRIQADVSGRDVIQEMDWSARQKARAYGLSGPF